LGAVIGLLGVAYNRTLLGALVAAKGLGRWWSAEVRATLIGVVVGLLAWFWPGLVGGGDAITQRTLAGGDSMMVVGLVFLVRFGLGPISYAAETPGGLFAPMLVLGAQSGLVLGTRSAAGSPTWLNAQQPLPLSGWPHSSPPSCVLQ
jgi:Chloride channel protein EriC